MDTMDDEFFRCKEPDFWDEPDFNDTSDGEYVRPRWKDVVEWIALVLSLLAWPVILWKVWRACLWFSGLATS